jgi:hypothetical protein
MSFICSCCNSEKNVANGKHFKLHIQKDKICDICWHLMITLKKAERHTFMTGSIIKSLSLNFPCSMGEAKKIFRV